MVTFAQVTEAQGDREIGNIPMDDPYWDILQAYRAEQVRRDPGIGEKKLHPLQERLTLAAVQDDERRRLEEEEADDDDDKDEDKEEEDEDDTSDEDNAPRKPAN